MKRPSLVANNCYHKQQMKKQLDKNITRYNFKFSANDLATVYNSANFADSMTNSFRKKLT